MIDIEDKALEAAVQEPWAEIWFRFMSGPWENAREPTIVRYYPDDGDPHIIATLKRIHDPDAIYELCNLANERMAMNAMKCGFIEAVDAAMKAAINWASARNKPEVGPACKAALHEDVAAARAALLAWGDRRRQEWESLTANPPAAAAAQDGV